MLSSTSTSFRSVLDRHRSRMQSTPIVTSSTSGEEQDARVVDIEAPAPASPRRRFSSRGTVGETTTSTTATTNPDQRRDNEEEDLDLQPVSLGEDEDEANGGSVNNRPNTSAASTGIFPRTGASFAATAAGLPPLVGLNSNNRAMHMRTTLAELEEERELSRRRSSACVLLSAFLLFRLWVLAIEEMDFGLLLICLIGTTWTARWISQSREREEELDRRIANYLENNNNNNSDGGGGEGGLVDRNELRLLSFQAQLALAIMESQRQMMQGGYGNPDGASGTQGVSDEAKARWDRYKFQHADCSNSNCAYGSVAPPTKKAGGEKDALVLDKNLDTEQPHCSICLGEYETGDDIVRLPCKHEYHDECITSWTSNHVKCPLCNLDLEDEGGDAATAVTEPTVSSASSRPEDSIV